MMLTGGSEAAITPLSFGGFSAMKAMCSSFNDNPKASPPTQPHVYAARAPSPSMQLTVMAGLARCAAQAGSRPFDAGRAGFVMGEGAGVLLLETEEHAKARGAKIYCELAGYSATCDAHHITTPHPEGAGLSECLRLALEDGGVLPEDVAYINAHGTSTAYNDMFETMAYKNVGSPLRPSLAPA